MNSAAANCEPRELVIDRERLYVLNGEESRALAVVGALRVVPEHELRSDRDTLDHLRDEGLIRTIALNEHDQGGCPHGRWSRPARRQSPRA